MLEKKQSRTKVITIRLPEDHPVFLLPEGRRSEFVRRRLDARPQDIDYELLRAVVEEAVRGVIREELSGLRIRDEEKEEKKAAVDPAELRQDILAVFG